MSDEAPSHISPFERIRHSTEAGDEYWTARDLMEVLGYAKWQRFREAIQRAVTACVNSGQNPADHFTGTGKMVVIGSGARRTVEDFHLSRYACYLIIQNADPNKEIVALGQTYFAVQTRRQEVSDAEALASLTENQRRLLLRERLVDHNTELAAAAQAAGVITSRDFAIFQDHGYMGLYGGLKARDIHERKGLKGGQQILDHMGSTELAANLFRATQAADKIRRDGVVGKDAANQTHYNVGQVVRRTITELGGTMPEDLPTPEQSIQELQAEQLRRLRQGDQLALFDEDDPPES
jgi:DNA-damage-inducible protein D